MMDTQRLIALVVFSFSALLLWDAWQKHNAPKAPVAVSAPAAAGVPSASAPLKPAGEAPANASGWANRNLWQTKSRNGST